MILAGVNGQRSEGRGFTRLVLNWQVCLGFDPEALLEPEPTKESPTMTRIKIRFPWLIPQGLIHGN